MVMTSFSTRMAKFIRLDVFKQGPREVSGRRRQQGKQAVEGGIRAPQKLQAGGGHGTIGQHTDRIQPGGKGAGTIKGTWQ
jgi:hypothetical protein